MQMIVCENCRKVYDYDKDEFCTRCGAYNQPGKAGAPVVRVDGVNERTHSGSFAHKEVHKEKAVRRFTGMDRPHPSKPAASSRQNSKPIKWIFWIVAVAVLYYVVLPVLVLLFGMM